MIQRAKQECSVCVMDTSDPDITFDAQGMCNYCQFANTQINYRKGEQLLLPWIINDIKKKGKGKKYDCVIGLSGGLDSSFALHRLVEQGVRPMAYTVDNGWNTKESDDNILRLVEKLKVPLFRYVLDIKAFREVQKAFILSGVPNIEIPTDHVLMAVQYEMAKKYGVKTIISGGNWQSEGTMPESYGYQPRDLTHIKDICKQVYAHRELKKIPTISLAQYLINRFVKRIKIVNLLDHYTYNIKEAKDLLRSRYGWNDYGNKHEESHFTKWFQNEWLYRKHGIDKRRAHLTSLIHSNQMTKAEAEQILKFKPEHVPFPFDGNYFDNIVVIENTGETTVSIKTTSVGGSLLLHHEIEPRSHHYYKTNQKWWLLLSKIYGYIPKFGRLQH